MNYNDDPPGGLRVGEVAAFFGGVLLVGYSGREPLFPERREGGPGVSPGGGLGAEPPVNGGQLFFQTLNPPCKIGIFLLALALAPPLNLDGI